MVALAALTVAIPLVGSSAVPGRDWRRWIAAAAIAVGLPLTALLLYARFGSPQLLSSVAASPSGPTNAPHPVESSGNAGAATDMNAAITRLETRLATHPDDAAGWQLLAQSYEFVGRASDAERARASAQGRAAPSAASARAPRSSDLDAAERARRARQFDQAVALFAKAAAAGPLTADQWADYADAVGAGQGKLWPASDPMIAAALRIDPNHPKALWLLGSMQTERGDRRGALATWRKLQALMPRDSPDARIIAANIAEASGPAQAPTTTARSAAVHGEVRLDPALRARTTPGMTLFIFAKAADQAGPPLAVQRVAAPSWPVSFVLDDSMAMMPDRKLSGFRRVAIEARLSRSGSADVAPGDLRGTTGVLDLASLRGPLAIVIDSVVN